jgi:hypothetical protein
MKGNGRKEHEMKVVKGNREITKRNEKNRNERK